MRIPLDKIDPHALIRDRSLIDAAAQTELQRSIAATGLRQPIEVVPTGDDGYGLLSGYRRLAATRALFDLTGQDRYAAIDCVVRDPASRQAALAEMVAENDIRQPLSPWEKAAIAVSALRAGLFETLDLALAGLYPHAARQKRAKLRALAEVVEALDGTLTDPETLSEARLLRIAAALRLGWGELIETALTEGPDHSAAQWLRILPLLEESEQLTARGESTHPDRPKRLLRLNSAHRNTVIRRERTRYGFLLHITGKGATDPLVDEVFREIERMFAG